MAWWASAWPLLALLALPFATLWPILRRAPGGPARLLLLLPAFWAAPLLVCLLLFDRRGSKAMDGGLLAACLLGGALQIMIAGHVGWRERRARPLAGASILVNAPATLLALAQGAAGASL